MSQELQVRNENLALTRANTRLTAVEARALVEKGFFNRMSAWIPILGKFLSGWLSGHRVNKIEQYAGVGQILKRLMLLMELVNEMLDGHYEFQDRIGKNAAFSPFVARIAENVAVSDGNRTMIETRLLLEKLGIFLDMGVGLWREVERFRTMIYGVPNNSELDKRKSDIEAALAMNDWRVCDADAEMSLLPAPSNKLLIGAGFYDGVLEKFAKPEPVVTLNLSEMHITVPEFTAEVTSLVKKLEQAFSQETGNKEFLKAAEEVLQDLLNLIKANDYGLLGVDGLNQCRAKLNELIILIDDPLKLAENIGAFRHEYEAVTRSANQLFAKFQALDIEITQLIARAAEVSDFSQDNKQALKVASERLQQLKAYLKIISITPDLKPVDVKMKLTAVESDLTLYRNLVNKVFAERAELQVIKVSPTAYLGEILRRTKILDGSRKADARFIDRERAEEIDTKFETICGAQKELAVLEEYSIGELEEIRLLEKMLDELTDSVASHVMENTLISSNLSNLLLVLNCEQQRDLAINDFDGYGQFYKKLQTLVKRVPQLEKQCDWVKIRSISNFLFRTLNSEWLQIHAVEKCSYSVSGGGNLNANFALSSAEAGSGQSYIFGKPHLYELQDYWQRKIGAIKMPDVESLYHKFCGSYGLTRCKYHCLMEIFFEEVMSVMKKYVCLETEEAMKEIIEMAIEEFSQKYLTMDDADQAFLSQRIIGLSMNTYYFNLVALFEHFKNKATLEQLFPEYGELSRELDELLNI